MQIPSNLIPKCLDDNLDVAIDSFMEDEGWHKASKNYYEFLQIIKISIFCFRIRCQNKPVIIKYPFSDDKKKTKSDICV